MATVLVVDDDKKVRDFVCETLRFAGYIAIVATDGLSGIQIAEERKPDLIVSDVHMPQLNGFQMLERIRTSPATSTIPVILLTAESTYARMREGMAGGADDYLVKPVSPRDLISSVKVQLQKRAALEEKHDTTLRLLRKNIMYALPHELRTPLHLISGYAHLLKIEQGRSAPEDILETADAIHEATSRLERLIENYLIYAQLELIHSDPAALEAAHNHLVKDVAPIIELAAADLSHKVKRSGDLRLELCSLALRISKENLAKIILELVDNAFKFSQPGTPVTVRAQRREDQLYIYICDEGRGMTSDEIELLGAYMQFGRELYEQQGVGLGYAVARRLIELHGGAIKVESKPNAGTMVSIRFPLN